jgi:signal transduction histidine kinase
VHQSHLKAEDMSRDARLENYRSLQEAVAALRTELERLPAAREHLEALISAADRVHTMAERDFRHFAHELRTPLNALAGWGQILRDHPGDTATVTRAVDVLERNVAALAKTIEAYTG